MGDGDWVQDGGQRISFLKLAAKFTTQHLDVSAQFLAFKLGF